MSEFSNLSITRRILRLREHMAKNDLATNTLRNTQTLPALIDDQSIESQANISFVPEDPLHREMQIEELYQYNLSSWRDWDQWEKWSQWSQWDQWVEWNRS